MRSVFRTSVAILGLGVCLVARGEDNTAMPSTQDIKSLVEAGKYKEALKPLFRVLALKGPAAQGYDRIELLMLRIDNIRHQRE